MSIAVFGRIVHGGMVADAVRDTLQLWLPNFLAEAEDQWGLDPGTIARPTRWVRTTSLDEVPAVGSPLIAIRNLGWLNPPTREGDGEMGMSEGVNVRAYIKGRNADESLTHAAMYAAVIRAVIEGKPSLGDFADGAWVLDEQPIPLAWRDRTLAAGEVSLRVDVPNVATRGAGPDTPMPEPPDVPDYPVFADPPEAETVNVSINPIEETT